MTAENKPVLGPMASVIADMDTQVLTADRAKDPELHAALDADFAMFWGGIFAGMDRADAEAIQAALAEKGEHTLH